MHAPLFFAMLRHGRQQERRRNYAKFYELSRVSMFPTMVKKSQEEYQQFLWDSAITDRDKEARLEFARELNEKEKASTVYRPSYAALQFFRGSTGGPS